MKYPGSKLKFGHGDAELFGASYVGSINAHKNMLKRKKYKKQIKN